MIVNSAPSIPLPLGSTTCPVSVAAGRSFTSMPPPSSTRLGRGQIPRRDDGRRCRRPSFRGPALRVPADLEFPFGVGDPILGAASRQNLHRRPLQGLAGIIVHDAADRRQTAERLFDPLGFSLGDRERLSLFRAGVILLVDPVHLIAAGRQSNAGDAVGIGHSTEWLVPRLTAKTDSSPFSTGLPLLSSLTKNSNRPPFDSAELHIADSLARLEVQFHRFGHPVGRSLCPLRATAPCIRPRTDCR